MSLVRTSAVLAEVYRTRKRRDALWGQQDFPDGTGGPQHRQAVENARILCDKLARAGATTWVPILTEEVAEALAASEPEELRAELLQVAAVAVAWIECLDRRKAHAHQA